MEGAGKPPLNLEFWVNGGEEGIRTLEALPDLHP